MNSIAKTAQLLAVSPAMIRKLITNGQIPVVRIGRCVRIPRDVIDELVSSWTIRPVSSASWAKDPHREAQ